MLSPPVNIKELAKNYGLEVIEFDFGEEANNISGFIDIEKKKIYVNSNDSENRKTFTVAHELGHWLLHREKLDTNPDYAILYRQPLGKANKDPIEAEANFFAATLLVPKELLDKEENKDPTYLAGRFKVSEEVIGYRLEDTKKKI